MAPTTRRTSRITPPPTHAEAHEANTIKKTRFFTIYDKDHTSRSLRSIAADANTTEGTGRRWLKQRGNMGSLAYRHTRPMSKKLGKPSKVTKSMCKMLVNPAKNPVRNQPYDAQITYHKIPFKRR